jgi:integrase
VCKRGGRLYDADRSDIIWQASDIREFCAVASVELQAALLLALWTGQREGNLLKLSWKNYDGTYLRLGQTKAKGGKGRRVTIPVGTPLKLALDAALKQKRTAVTILTNSRGCTMDRGRLPHIVGQGIRQNEPWRSSFPRPAGDSRNSAGALQLHSP